MVEKGWAAEGDTGGFTYFDSVLGGPVHDDQQADLIAADFAEAIGDGLTIRAMGHSNGCRILAHLLIRHPALKLGELHLVAAAIPDDCEKSGLNDAARRGQIGKVVFYVSAGDEVLGLPMISYGDAGKVGPRNVCPELAAILQVVHSPAPGCRHSDWVGKDFQATMARVAGGADGGVAGNGPQISQMASEAP
jgi:pimeloyl-ACP methyl ester carboxylesterase